MTSAADTPVRVGTRRSTLATTQTGHVIACLTELLDRPVEPVLIRTDGDVLTGSLAALGGAGVFVAALREAVLDGRCDLAVHSLKDLPAADVPGLTLFTPAREDPHDVLCAPPGTTWQNLPSGARVGTGSPRRAAQLRALRPNIEPVDIRGNVDTRLARALGPKADLDAVVLARAGLARLGRLDAVSSVFDAVDMTPAPGQGALAIEAGEAALADPSLAAALAALDDEATHLAVTAERALLEHLGAGCAAPVGALGTLSGTTLGLRAVVVSLDGTRRLARAGEVTLPETGRRAAARQLGIDVAQALLDGGAADVAPLGV
ncbi:MAG: hydroxymethylbilane synthase [Propionibacteriaceae bacterium]|nr:hydroxymethylbilane synthase [Propionibacteriaceae bacterium]